MSVGLMYQSRELAITEDFSIKWEVEDDLFDFDALGQAYSWTISLPIKGNEWAFLYASDPATRKTRFKNYDDFAITWHGNKIWSCSFELTAVSDDAQYYEGVLSTTTSAFYDNKSKKISELVSEEIAIQNGTYQQIIEAVNNLDDSNLRFPFVHFYNDRTSVPIFIDFQDGNARTEYYNEPVANRSAYYVIPAFKLHYILRLAIEATGLKLVLDNVDKELDQLLIISNRPIDQQGNPLGLSTYFDPVNNLIDVAKYLPDMTLADLIKDYMFYTGKNISIDGNTLIFTSISRKISTEAAAIDLGFDYDPKVIPKQSPVNGVSITYGFDDDISKAENEITGSYQGAVINTNSISSSTVGDSFFVKELNRYVILVDAVGNDAIAYKNIASPYSTLKLGDQNAAKEWLPKILPAATKDRHTYKLFNTECLVGDDGTGKIEITGDFGSIASGSKIGWVREDEPEGQVDLLFVVASVTTTSLDTIVINEDYLSDFKISKLIVATAINYVIPVIQNDVYYPEIGNTRGENFAGRIMFWRGMVNDSVSTPYPFASPDFYGVNGAIVGSYSLDTVNTSHIYRIWNIIYNFLSNSRIIKLKTNLIMPQILRLQRSRLRHHKGVILFRRLSVLFARGIRDQEVEGYRL